MNVRDWSFFSSKEGTTEIKEHILDTVSLWGAMGLLWYSFISMIEEYFPEFLQATVEIKEVGVNPTSVVKPPQYATVDMDWWVICLFVFVLWLAYEWPKRYLKKLTIPCLIAGIVIPVAYVVVNFERIIDGVLGLAWFYLPFANSYYKRSFYLGLPSSEANAVITFTAICMLLWWLVWLLAYVCKKRILLALFPVFALAVELLVGLSPLGNGLLCWLFGVVILAIMGGSSVVKKVIVLASVGLSILLSNFFFGGSIQSLATKEMKQAVLDWQNNFDLSKLLKIDFHYNWEQLDNDSPRYTGEVALEVKSDKIPASTLYLRGFYGTNYEDGNWRYDDSYFKETCAAAMKSETEVAQDIFQMLLERKKYYHDLSNEMIRYQIDYVGTTGDVAYSTYGSDYESLDEDYTFLGDYLLKKSIWDDTVSVSAVDSGYLVSDWRTTNVYLEENDAVSADANWINGLAEAYLEVPEDAAYIKEALSEAEKWLVQTGYEYKGIELSPIESENDRRIRYTTAISKYLSIQMSYSLRLDDLPANADPIEYALMESHEGYCMHFASAATLLLREAEIPARYVSGYAINPSKFYYDKEADAFTAEVPDYMAHAWVEIYLDYIGWVPVEVTPGSSLEELPTDEQISDWESNSNDRRDQLNNENQTEVEESEESSQDTQSEVESQTEQETESEKEKDNHGNGSGDAKFMDMILQGVKILGILGVFVAIIFSVFVGVKRWIRGYDAALIREIERNLTRRAVKRINRRLYFMLRISKGRNWFMRKWTDAEYKAALIENFTAVTEKEWNLYMEIVKKNHYSYENISTEEMMYVYECYKKANIFNIFLTRK